ncbi:efflux RND transporter periplasmic adaptor subunit [Curvivirga aplysinae]|uniref:efflux RND transporter periplasmic adaptor subunit n=1 Tax=Curvivirga aplysinae TaxID=2529852 RepID=UPI001C3FAE4D|nr:efflux RND transporter periplasmic adaptor subunit [Curvivirga aplysinae]
MLRSRFNIKPSVLIAVGLATGIGLWLWSGQDLHANTENPLDEVGQEEKLPSYKTSVRYVDSAAINHQASIQITAQTQYDRVATIRAETYGKIVKLDMEETYPVEKNTLITQLAIQDRGSQIKRAEAILEQREIEFEAATKLAKKGFNSQIRKAEALANLESAKSDLHVARKNYANTSVRSPFDGIIQTQSVELGDYVQEGDPIATIVDMNPIYIVAYVSEKEINSISLDSEATGTLINGEQITGLVSHISPTALESTRSFEVKVEVPNPDGKILSGLTASVTLPLGQTKAHLLSPALLTLNNAGNIGVKTLSDDDIVEFNQVNIIEDTEKGVWVSGLPNNIRIIAVGQEFVAAGAQVTATPLNVNSASNS